MRSSEALMRSALTTMRRSRATGCCRARIVIASSSSATVAWSMRGSSAMTSSARLTSDSLNARVAFSIEIGDELGDLDESVLHLAQFLLEHLTHVEILVCSVPRRRRTRAHRFDPAPDILPAPGEQQVP